MSGERHYPGKSVRDYLLKLSSPGSAVAIEDRYFTDPDFLKLVDLEEQQLIEDYLQGRLPREDHAQFKRVYVLNPHLAGKLEEARRRLPAAGKSREGQRRVWAFGMAVTVSAGVLFLAVLSPKSHLPSSVLTRTAPMADEFVEIRLAPGLTKGLGPQPVVTVGSATRRLRITVEMPGITGPVACRLRLSRIEPDGNRTEIRISPIASSRPGLNSEAHFEFLNSALTAGDFEAELSRANGTILERYLFQVR